MHITYKKHISTLDGLRGISVLSIMIFHFAHVKRLTHNLFDDVFYNISMLGWVGVDLFFTLSGFLITGILLDTKKTDNYFTSFYARRALRIFPLYYGYLAFLFYLFYPLIFSKTHSLEQLNIDNVIDNKYWFIFYLSNIKQLLLGSFFSGGVGHLWSLAIEEQFYLIWPLVIYMTSTRYIKYICYALFITNLSIRFYMVIKGYSADDIYVFTFSRLDSLVAGSLIAVMVRSKNKVNFFILKPIIFALPILFSIF